MARTVTFKGGKTVTFRRKTRRGGKRKLTIYQKFAQIELKKLAKKGKKGPVAMRAVGRAWRKKQH